jgi:hypothetical protein
MSLNPAPDGDDGVMTRRDGQADPVVGAVGLVLLAGLFVATGVVAHFSSPSTNTAPSVLPSVERSGPGRYTIWFVHPAWGLVKLVTELTSDPGPASLTVTDASDVLRFFFWHEHLYAFGPAGTHPQADPQDQVRSPVDALGHIFLGFDPGRYNGVIVLVPTRDGFDDLGTLPPPDDYQTRFYCASVVDVDHDGVYEVVEPPFCGSGTYRWRGTDYVPD